MRLASFVTGGRATFGIVRNDGVTDLAQRTGCQTLAELLAAGGLKQAQRWQAATPDVGIDDVRFLPTIPNPCHIVCVGTNYASHIAEVAGAGIRRDTPSRPSVFLRAAGSLAGHRQPLVCPRVSECLDYEGELAVVIGSAGRYVAEQDALSLVAGYTCFNDASVRDWQFHTNNITPGKNFPHTGGLGPSVVTADEVAEPQHLRIRTRLNGEIVQDGSTADMIFNIAQIISYVSCFIPLVPGDVIATGTPHGVGFSRKPPLYMAPGDVCEVEIESVGFLRNPVISEQP